MPVEGGLDVEATVPLLLRFVLLLRGSGHGQFADKREAVGRAALLSSASVIPADKCILRTMTPVHSRLTRPAGLSSPQFAAPKYAATEPARYVATCGLTTESSVSPNSEMPWSGSLAQPPVPHVVSVVRQSQGNRGSAFTPDTDIPRKLGPLGPWNHVLVPVSVDETVRRRQATTIRQTRTGTLRRHLAAQRDNDALETGVQMCGVAVAREDASACRDAAPWCDD